VLGFFVGHMLQDIIVRFFLGFCFLDVFFAVQRSEQFDTKIDWILSSYLPHTWPGR